MTKLIYTKLPIDQIEYLDRPEFHTDEKKFKDSLTASIQKNGIIEPVYAEYGNDYGPKIKVIVGNNRMTVAKALGIKEVPIIVNIYTALIIIDIIIYKISYRKCTNCSNSSPNN